METREKLLNSVKRILVGPNPLPGYTQENGEEILYFDSPLKTYVAGVLFPQIKLISDIQEETITESSEETTTYTPPDETIDPNSELIKGTTIAEPTIESETSRINNYQQSAMGITFCVPIQMEKISVDFSIGSYFEQERVYPKEKKDENGIPKIVFSDKPHKCYCRKQITSSLVLKKEELPNKFNKHILKNNLLDENCETIIGIGITITYRLTDNDGNTIYTVTLLNTNKGEGSQPKVSACWFQVGFNVSCNKGLVPLPDNFCTEINDDDYKLNAMLYRNIKTYAIGHGCAATWNEENPTTASASVLPEYEVKPIVAGDSKAERSMITYYSEVDATLKDLDLLCEEYNTWIKQEEKNIPDIEAKHQETARIQIALCKKCFERMLAGVNLLKSDKKVMHAFQLANKAMLMQQLHYRLPLVEYSDYDKKTFSFILNHKIDLPKLDDSSTWYGDKTAYGKWRPFQIAFILINLVSMNDSNSLERDIVDLIWFSTGGGKTEAYLGLTAFTIFLRRLKNKDDAGTAVIMRYTLRLLTAQQYERASSLICSMEKIRSENESELGKQRITIGLWVGKSLTSNKTSDVKEKINSIRRGKDSQNVSVILKCPWCGASMETYKTGSTAETPGYVISPDKKHILFKCGNEKCDFGNDDYPLPLVLFDDEIYDNPPTLLFGTVDKFAMLPYIPEAKSLFGGDGEYTPPELIIQDELHLITGPLGSAVGLYETLISELCKRDGHKPKIIASTATISHAKQQCNALYGCGENNVSQFPVQGISYDDCFFAKEQRTAIGRKYVGLYGAAASSSATASIYTFAAFLYAAKEIDVQNECDRDPYWTNLAYFGSMRELGQAATWFIADIKERLEVLYKYRLQTMKADRRYIYENGLAELTSRMSNDEIPKILKRLESTYDGEKSNRALDVCLATNMVSVGVDISRLGLMTVTGQPKSSSEYIQATSRVGRDKRAPGLVFIIYNTSKPRDKSHYEKFQTQHSKLYFSVEPTSVTPFSRPLRERALQAVFVALHRFFIEKENRNNARRVPSQEEFEHILKIITDRAQGIDPEEIDDIKIQLKEKWNEWKSWKPEKFHSFVLSETAPLLCIAGTPKPQSWEDRGWASPTSMRSVDRECGLSCAKSLILPVTEDNNG